MARSLLDVSSGLLIVCLPGHQRKSGTWIISCPRTNCHLAQWETIQVLREQSSPGLHPQPPARKGSALWGWSGTRQMGPDNPGRLQPCVQAQVQGEGRGDKFIEKAEWTFLLNSLHNYSWPPEARILGTAEAHDLKEDSVPGGGQLGSLSPSSVLSHDCCLTLPPSTPRYPAAADSRVKGESPVHTLALSWSRRDLMKFWISLTIL